jgi:hypothetical protein
MYKVFKYFHKEDLETVAREKFHYFSLPYCKMIPVAAGGYCPLGLLVELDAKRTGRRPTSRIPSTWEVVRYLNDLQVSRSVKLFTKAWDKGRVKDLAKAMGLK